MQARLPPSQIQFQDLNYINTVLNYINKDLKHINTDLNYIIQVCILSLRPTSVSRHRSLQRVPLDFLFWHDCSMLHQIAYGAFKQRLNLYADRIAVAKAKMEGGPAL